MQGTVIKKLLAFVEPITMLTKITIKGLYPGPAESILSPYYFSNIHLCLHLPSDLFPLRLLTTILNAILTSPGHAIHLIHLDLITLNILGEEYNYKVSHYLMFSVAF
jgi:hypothetical protein